MADPIRQRGYVTHRRVACGSCGNQQTISTAAVGKLPCAGCGTILHITKGASTFNPPAPR